MSYDGNGDEKLIDHQFFFTFRKDAWDVEQTLLDHFDKHRAFGKYSNNPKMPLSGRGQSELFARDVLGLDVDLYKPPDQIASKAIQEQHKQTGEGCLLILVGLALAPFTLGLSLFFIAGGASDVFNLGKNRQLDLMPTRLIHPPTIQDLVIALSRK